MHFKPPSILHEYVHVRNNLDIGFWVIASSNYFIMSLCSFSLWLHVILASYTPTIYPPTHLFYTFILHGAIQSYKKQKHPTSMNARKYFWIESKRMILCISCINRAKSIERISISSSLYTISFAKHPILF